MYSRKRTRYLSFYDHSDQSVSEIWDLFGRLFYLDHFIVSKLAMLEKLDCLIGTQDEFLLKIFGEWILGGLPFARGNLSQSHCLKN